jgi:hypothetical protein
MILSFLPHPRWVPHFSSTLSPGITIVLRNTGAPGLNEGVNAIRKKRKRRHVPIKASELFTNFLEKGNQSFYNVTSSWYGQWRKTYGSFLCSLELT